MLNRSVAVIDVRSSDVTAVVAERGVNKTFVIKSKFSACSIFCNMIHSRYEQQSKSTSDSCRKTYAFSSVTVMESDFFGSVFLKIFLYLIFH